MRNLLQFVLALSIGLANCYAQGLVKFANTADTLISYEGVPTAPGSGFLYALLTAPVGSTDYADFVFSGLYATNTAAITGGRFQGGPGTGVPVPGWLPGTSRSFIVAGWSTQLGSVWNENFRTNWNVGFSEIGSGMAGGTDSNGTVLLTLPLFGSPPLISRGFEIVFIPEPVPVAIAIVYAVGFAVKRRRGLRAPGPVGSTKLTDTNAIGTGPFLYRCGPESDLRVEAKVAL